MVKVAEIIGVLNNYAPYTYQESYDNSGLIVGSMDMEVKGVLVSLDCTEEIVEEAISLGVNVIVSHHPIIFSGLKRLTDNTYIERTVTKAIQNNIALISCHTNLDNVYFGVNHVIATKLGLVNQQILAPKEATLFKLTVFTPIESAEKVRLAMGEAGAGQIGDYDYCSFAVDGIGKFRPLPGANPAIGIVGSHEEVGETRIEVTVNRHQLKGVVAAMKKVHPYEEIAYDVVALSSKNAYLGSGMVGELEIEMDEIEFLNFVKKQFHCGSIRHTSLLNKKVKRIAVCGGSGSFLLNSAKAENADIFITADFKYHEFFDADNQIIIADIGHFESEQFTSELLVSLLNKKFTTFAVRLTNVNTNPINYL